MADMTHLTELPKRWDSELIIVGGSNQVPLPTVRHLVQRFIDQLLASGKARVAIRGVAQIDGKDELFFRALIIELGDTE